MGRKFYRVKKIWVGNFIGLKNLGRKFGLAKFYFGLVRFVCDLLLITAKLNNNNTEFVWWWVPTHNVVKPTSTWLWLSWVLTIEKACCLVLKSFYNLKFLQILKSFY